MRFVVAVLDAFETAVPDAAQIGSAVGVGDLAAVFPARYSDGL
jgi:hypothetical protein